MRLAVASAEYGQDGRDMNFTDEEFQEVLRAAGSRRDAILAVCAAQGKELPVSAAPEPESPAAVEGADAEAPTLEEEAE